MSQVVLVRTLRGLEPLAATELQQRLVPARLELAHREVRVAVPSLTGALLGLGLADDAFLVLADGPPVGPRRADLAGVRHVATRVDVEAAATVLRPLRPVGARTFDVTASFLGRRNYSRFGVEDAVADAVEAATGWRRRPSGGSLSLRAHLTSERTTLAARIAAVPLHRRPYRTASRPGALHPPLARALAVLAAPRPVGVLLDPFCGTGTISIEAMAAGCARRVAASDLDAAALAAARVNAAAARVALELRRADAARLSPAAGSIGAIATNPPWGSHVAPAGLLREGIAPFWAEAARVLRPGGRIVALLPPHVAGPATTVERIPVRVSGALVEIAVARS